MDAPALYRAAGTSALLAIPALVLSGVFLALFFSGKGEIYGPLNDFFSAVMLLLLALPVWAAYLLVRDGTGAWIGVVTGLALLGIIIGAGGQLLLIAGAISLQTSFVTGGIGFGLVVVWFMALPVLALRLSQHPVDVGWWTVATLSLIVALGGVSVLRMWMMAGILGTVLSLVLAGWMQSLGRFLLQQA